MSRAVRVSIPGESGLEPVDVEPRDDGPAILLEADGRASIPAPRGRGDTPTGARTALWSRLPGRRAGVDRIEVVVDGWRFEVEVEDARRAALRERATRRTEATGSSGPAEVRAIIPGRVAAVRVVAGDTVDAGATLLVVEAMKMQNELRAPRAGRIERLAVGEGQTIETGDLLVVIE